VGQVKVFVELTNTTDLDNFQSEIIAENQVRIHSTEGLIDTGAVLSMLPKEIIEQLGLRYRRKAIVTFADERRDEMEVYGPVSIKIKNREAIIEVLMGPPFSEPLVGQIVLESLDLLVDCTNQTLMVRPESPLLPMLKLK
jgi:clan AA aspartic protease